MELADFQLSDTLLIIVFVLTTCFITYMLYAYYDSEWPFHK